MVNVLVVDDDEGIRQIMKMALSFEDGVGEIREASNGRLALEECESFTPNLVLLDYWMPDMDGGTTAGHLKLICPEAHIVAFSGALETKPEWAEHHVVKGELPDLKLLIDLASL